MRAARSSSSATTSRRRPARTWSSAASHGSRLAPSKDAAFGRILLKLSGEALMGELEYGADPQRIASIAHAVKGVTDRDVEVAIVVGGGNIYRGLQGRAGALDRPP